MARILIDLPESDIAWLDNLAAASNRSRAAVLREAVAAFRGSNADWLERGFGLWTQYGGGRDGDEFEETVRPLWKTPGSVGTESGDS
jgi:hypothetical protein